jgi:glycosyltransferase involved in cell wall biosynthesis
MRRIRQACANAGTQADGLLIRGITPRQRTVWRSTGVQRKAFLLVGSLKQEGKHLTWSITKGYLAIMARHRLGELRNIAKDATLLANSPMVVSEIEDLFEREAQFVPTNSLRGSEFAPLQVRNLSAIPKLLYCGRVIPEKGIEDLLQAIAIVARTGQRCHLNVVGPVTRPIQTKLKELTLDLALDVQVSWYGVVPYGARLFELYRDADAFVLPSHSEGFPHAIWEAAANGCPVVTTTAGGIPALWKHERHGLLVPPRNVGLLAHAIQRLLNDTTLRHTLIRQAYSYAKDFTVEACAKRLSVVLSQEWGISK